MIWEGLLKRSENTPMKLIPKIHKNDLTKTTKTLFSDLRPQNYKFKSRIRELENGG